jgi:drug/metabolite transporter (DMT)-like permease
MMAVRCIAEIIGRVFFALALTLTPISSASAILQATPLLVVLGAALLFREQVTPLRWGLVALGFIGVLIIIRPAGADFSVLSLLAVVAMAGFAGRDLATRAARPALSNAQLGVTGFLMLFLSGLILLATNPPAQFTFAFMHLPPILGAAVFAVIGYGALTVAMRTGDVAAVTPLRYSRLIFALILGTTLFGERPDLSTLIGAAVIVISGIALMLRKA